MQNQSQPKYLPIRHWPALALFSLAKVIAKLPLSIQVMLGKFIGKLLYLFARRRREIATINLNLCFPEKAPQQINQLLKQSFQLTGLAFVETAACWFSDLSRHRAIAKIEGVEHLDEALNKGKGVILLSFHLTSLEMGGCLLGHHFPLTAMYKPNKTPVMENMMTQGRLNHVAQLIQQNDVRATIKALKNNQIVWYATDQNYGTKSSIFVPFFGTQAATITATTKFSKLTGATVIPFTQKRAPNGQQFELTLHPPLTHIPGESETHDAIAINQFLENYLRQQPADYMWIHQRFRTRPSGEPPIYKKRTKQKR